MAKIININGKDLAFAESLPKDYSKLDVVFDCEANGLLDKVSELYIIAAQDIRTKEFYVFTPMFKNYNFPRHGSLEDGAKFLTKCRSIVAHNVSGYDWWLLNKFFPKIFNRKTVPWSKTHDTLCQSRSQWYDRPAQAGVKTRHGLEYYGSLFGYPKPPIEDWSFWDEDKLKRCLVDVEINRQTLIYLNKERKERKDMGIDFSFQINVTKYAQYRLAQQEMNGLKGNRKLMQKHVKTLDEQIQELTDKVEPLLPKKLCVNAIKATWEEVSEKWDEFYNKVPSTEYEKARRNGSIVDVAVKPTYFPVTQYYSAEPKINDKPVKWFKMAKKDLVYSARTCKIFDLPFDDPNYCDWLIQGDFCVVDIENHYRKYKPNIAEWFGIDQNPVKSNHLIEGAFTRVFYEDTKLTQHAEVKNFLLSLGWEPTEWNKKKDVYGNFLKNPDGSYVNGSPKLTEDSFDTIPEGIGQDIAKYNTLMHRRRTFINDEDENKGWLNLLDECDRIRAGASVFATSTGRHSQFGINRL